MKLITAIIPPHRLEAAKVELGKVQVYRLTVMDVQGLSDKSEAESASSAADAWRAAHEVGQARPMIKLVIAVNEDFVAPTVGAIQRAVRIDGLPTRAGRILIQPLEECIRIRTGERGSAAI